MGQMKDCVNMMSGLGHVAPSVAVAASQEMASTAADDLQHAAEIHQPAKKKPGRQPGFSPKAKAEETPVDRPRHEDPPPEPEVIPTEKEVQDALVAVNDKFGIDKAIECLSKFGVKRARELVEGQRAEFVKLCKSVIA